MNITIVQGENKSLRLSVTDKNDIVVDLTGSTLTLTVKSKVGETTNLIQKISTDIAEIKITDAVNGIAEIYFVPVDTQTLDPLDYVYDLWVKFPDTRAFAIVKVSNFNVTERVTVL